MVLTLPTCIVAVDNWVKQAGRGKAKYVLVEIDEGTLRGPRKDAVKPGEKTVISLSPYLLMKCFC